MNIDLKSFSEKFYNKRCKAKLKPVRNNIMYYFYKKLWVEITTLIIPGENDSSKELEQIAQFIYSIDKSIPWHITKFTPAYKMASTTPTPEEKLFKAYKIGKNIGLQFVYAGNIFNKDLQSTYCPNCNEMLIERDWGYTEIKNLKHGKCQKCGYTIPGVWK